MIITYDLNYVDEREINERAERRDEVFGDIILQAMGYAPTCTCTVFCKCKRGGYNIGWMLENGDEYINTFTLGDILARLKGKQVKVDIRVTSD